MFRFGLILTRTVPLLLAACHPQPGTFRPGKAPADNKAAALVTVRSCKSPPTLLATCLAPPVLGKLRGQLASVDRQWNNSRWNRELEATVLEVPGRPSLWVVRATLAPLAAAPSTEVAGDPVYCLQVASVEATRTETVYELCGDGEEQGSLPEYEVKDFLGDPSPEVVVWESGRYMPQSHHVVVWHHGPAGWAKHGPLDFGDHPDACVGYPQHDLVRDAVVFRCELVEEGGGSEPGGRVSPGNRFRWNGRGFVRGRPQSR